jgi:hypothetical protein
MSVGSQTSERRTVGQELDEIEHRLHVGTARSPDQTLAVEERRRMLSTFPREMLLLNFGEAQMSEYLTEEQKFVLRWQYADSYGASDSERALFACLHCFDDDNLDKLALGFPLAVRAARNWREYPEFARHLRALPLAFDI